MLRGQFVVFIIERVCRSRDNTECSLFRGNQLHAYTQPGIRVCSLLYTAIVFSECALLFKKKKKLCCVCECRFIFIKMLEITFQSLVYVSFPGFYLLDSFPRVPFCLSSKVKKYSLYLESGRWGYSLIPSWEIHFYYWPIPWGVVSGSGASLSNHRVILTLDDECQSGAGQGFGQAPHKAAPVMQWESGCSFITQTWTCRSLKENNTPRGHMT